MEVGDTLHLQTHSSDYFSGDLWELTLCVNLFTWDPSHFNRTMPMVEGPV